MSTRTMRLDSINAINTETNYAIKKHGGDGITNGTWERVSCILSEESGEVAKEILDATVNERKPTRKELRRIYEEAVDTASVAVRIMERCSEQLAREDL